MKRISLLLMAVIGCQAVDVVGTFSDVIVSGGALGGVGTATESRLSGGGAAFSQRLLVGIAGNSTPSAFYGTRPTTNEANATIVGGGMVTTSCLYSVADLNGGGFRGGRYTAADPNLYIMSGWLSDGAAVRAGIKFSTTPAAATAPLANALTRMEITPDGNVTIGDFTGVTPAPTAKLAVNGTITAKEIKVTTNGADYVFENDYKLRPLAEVEKFITEHKHLPEMMSAKAMQADGMPVSEVVTKQLAKIEELTLYAIKSDRERQAQADRLAALEKQVADMAAANAQLTTSVQALLTHVE